MVSGDRDAPIPVTIVTGFLGAGKTTLVNRLLSADHGERIAVIVNEFGTVGIDGRLIVATEDEIVELRNGCICCSVRGDLVRALGTLLAKRKRFLRPLAFDRIVIETSGLASPGPVLQTLALEEELARSTYADGVVALANATSIAAELETTAEAEEQIAYADLVLLNHVDRADELTLARAEAAIAELNPLAPIRRTARAAADLPALFGLARRSRPRSGVAHDHTGHAHTSDARSCVLRTERALDLHALKLWLSFATQRNPETLWRVKGVVRCVGHARALAVQAVRQWLEISPLEEEAPQESVLVVIGRALDEAELRRGHEACSR